MQVTYVSHYLTDKDVANFARQSFDKRAEDYTDEQNANLIRYLARGMPTKELDTLAESVASELNPIGARQDLIDFKNTSTHWVPLAHPHITLRVSAPVPIRVQCFKSKIGFVESEESRRYIKSAPNVFVPETFRAAAANVKQGSGGTHYRSDYWRTHYQYMVDHAVAAYEAMIEDGVCPEQARFVLPQGCEVNWVWTGSLYAYAKFCLQRFNSHAQKEIQELAHQIDRIMEPLYPVSWPALLGNY